MSLSRSKKFFFSTVTTALYQIVLFLAGFITPKVMLVYYSSEINGLVSSLMQFITYFNLVEAGLSGAAVYALYKPLANGDHQETSSIVSAARQFYYKAGYIFLCLITVLALLYPFLIQSSLSNVEIALLVFVLGGNSFLEFFSLAKYRALLSADQKTYIISLASIIHVILNTVIIYLCAIWGMNIVVLRAVALISIFVRTLILMCYVKKKYPYVDFNAKPKDNALDKRWDALYMQVLGAIHTGSPVLILTFVVRNLPLISVFSIYNMVITGLHGIMSIFSSGLSAGFGDMIVRKEYSTLRKSYQEFEVAYLTIMTIIYTTSMVMILPFVDIYTTGITDANYHLPLVGFLIVFNAFVFNIKSPQAMLLIAAGLYKESRRQTTIQGALAVVLGVLFAFFWQIEGILIACIISNIYRDIDLLFFIPKHVTSLPISNSLNRWLRSIICMIIVVLFFHIKDFNPTGYYEWTLYAIVVALTISIVCLISDFCFDREAIIGTAKRLKMVLWKQ